jgi:hypothetical protein
VGEAGEERKGGKETGGFCVLSPTCRLGHRAAGRTGGAGGAGGAGGEKGGRVTPGGYQE